MNANCLNMKCYRLLRSNKETGPFTSEELIEMGLKPYDLIWVDGKSAAWRYPSEINELKSFAPVVEEQPFDRFYKKPEEEVAELQEAPGIELRQADKAPVINGSKPEVAPQAKPEFIPAEIKKEAPAHKTEKPRIRIKADWSKVEPVIVATTSDKQADAQVYSTNGNHQKPVHQQNTSSSSPVEWSQAYNNWEKEKTEEVSKKPAPIVVIPDKADPVILETKFVQPLDAIKERYEKTVLNRVEEKPPVNKNLRIVAPTVFFIAVLVFGLYWTNRNVPENSTPPSETSQVVSTGEEQPQQNNIEENNSPVRKSESETARITTENSNDVVTDNRQANTENNNVIKNSDNPVETAAAKNNIDEADRIIAVNDKLKKEEEKTEVKNESTAPSEKKTNYSFASKNKTVDDYVTTKRMVQNANQGENMSIDVRNVSDIPLDLVVVDLQYYDANGKYRKGESIYLKNFPPSKTVPVKIPGDKESVKVTAKVSLLTSEARGIYLIAD